MTTLMAEPERLTPVVKYNISDAGIEELKNEYGGLTVATAGYDAVRRALSDMVSRRTRIEKMRVELKAGALEYGRKVDSEAKRITVRLLEIEEPLRVEKAKVDDEKTRIKREKEEAERAKVEAELKAKRDAEEAAAKAERDRIAAEQAAEAARLAEERRQLDAERAAAEAERAAAQTIIDEQNRAAEAKLAEERAAIEAERQRIDRERFEREARERAEREANEKAERAAAEAKAAEERAREEHERLQALRPDMLKLVDFANELLAMKGPAVTSSEAMHAVDRTLATVREQAGVLLEYAQKLQPAK